MLVWLSVYSDSADCLHMVELMPVHSKTSSFLASFKSGLFLPFWYQLSQVVLEKRPLNGCTSVPRTMADAVCLTFFDQAVFVLYRNIKTGVDAITCFLHACRHQHEYKSRKYLARVIWLLTYDDEKLSLAEAVDKYSVGIQPLHWLPW